VEDFDAKEYYLDESDYNDKNEVENKKVDEFVCGLEEYKNNIFMVLKSACVRDIIGFNRKETLVDINPENLNKDSPVFDNKKRYREGLKLLIDGIPSKIDDKSINSLGMENKSINLTSFPRTSSLSDSCSLSYENSCKGVSKYPV
jgi:hypothetical protein